MRLCCEGPLVQVDPEGAFTSGSAPTRRASIVAGLNGGEVTARRGDPGRPFFTRQKPIVLENSGADRARADRVVHRRRGLPLALRGGPRDEPRRGDRRGHPERPARPGRRRLSHGAEVGDGRQEPGARTSTSSATPTRATPARSWTAACSRATRTGSSRAWPSRPTRSGPSRDTSTSAASIPWPFAASRREFARRGGSGLLGTQIFESPFNFRVDLPDRRRGLRLRRGDGAAWPRSRAAAAFPGLAPPTPPRPASGATRP